MDGRVKPGHDEKERYTLSEITALGDNAIEAIGEKSSQLGRRFIHPIGPSRVSIGPFGTLEILNSHQHELRERIPSGMNRQLG